MTIILLAGVDLLRAFGPFGESVLLNTLPSFLPALFIPLAITQQYFDVSYKEVLVNATGANVGFLLYEYLQKSIPWGTFVTNDLIAIIIGHCLFMVGFCLVILFSTAEQKLDDDSLKNISLEHYLIINAQTR